MAMFGQDGFRVELHALDIEFRVAHTHDLAVVGPRSDFQTSGAMLAINR